MLPPLEFNDWVKQFPISPETKKRAEKILKQLKENNKSFIAQSMKIKVYK
jgi:endonuclease I